MFWDIVMILVTFLSGVLITVIYLGTRIMQLEDQLRASEEREE